MPPLPPLEKSMELYNIFFVYQFYINYMYMRLHVLYCRPLMTGKNLSAARLCNIIMLLF